jgi:lysophospholipase L1-like esterase
MQDSQGSSDKAEARPVGPRGTPLANLTLVVVSLLLSLILIEIGYRVTAGLPIFKLANWRTEQVSLFRFGAERATTDPVLGWTNLPWTNSESFETIDYGIRRNSKETTVRAGGILAVGDSFTEGWEVDGHESWPAVLEGMIGVPVVNGGIGGYGTDQIILRAEQLLPIVKPKILIIGFLEDDISRAAYSVFGAPKPYFTIDNGELRYHPPGPLEPRALGSLTSSIGFTLRNGLGYFAAADHVLARLNPDFWYGTESEMFHRRADVDEVEVTCALLRRLKAKADREGIRTILFVQYTAQAILFSGRRTREVQNVMVCARNAGIRVADQFSFLLGAAVRDRNAMMEYYVYDDKDYGHMSAKGNWHAAGMLSVALQDWLKALHEAQ